LALTVGRLKDGWKALLVAELDKEFSIPVLVGCLLTLGFDTEGRVVLGEMLL